MKLRTPSWISYSLLKTPEGSFLYLDLARAPVFRLDIVTYYTFTAMYSAMILLGFTENFIIIFLCLKKRVRYNGGRYEIKTNIEDVV